MEHKRIPQQDVEKWLQRLQESAPSKVLREVAEAYGADRLQLAMMLNDLFVGVSTAEVQMIWHWKLSEKERGLSDEEIDGSLGNLAVRK